MARTAAWTAAAATVALAAAVAGVVAQEPLNIWLVAHSHDDTGWLRTIDEYYVYEVQYILDSVTDALLLNPDRKFIEVEMAFFSRWWWDQTETRKNQVRQLVANKQLVFVNGGWCMNDDAVPIYYAMIDQMTLAFSPLIPGHEFLQSEFGDDGKPTVGWHIDPFGHSNVIAPLYNMTGFDAWYVNRIDYRLQNELKDTKEMEFIWHGSKSLGSEYPMWAHLMDQHYCTPDGFNWEHGVTQNLPEGDGPPPIIVDPPSRYTEANDLERATEFVNLARERAAVYKTNNILIPFGCDFTFQNANMMFKNMDLLIDAINRYSDQLNAIARYTSLDDYAAAVKQATTNWTVRTEDFYPYADNGRSYWTGYFSSRPHLKSLSRTAHNALRAVDFAHTYARAQYPVDREAQMNQVFTLRGAEAVVQHHDGVTGTFRQLVGEDYVKYLTGGMELTNDVIADNLGRIATNGGVNQLSADSATLSEGLLTGRTVPVLLYNTLGWTRATVVRLDVPISNVEAFDADNQELAVQVNEKEEGEGYELYVRVTLPAVGFNTIYVRPTTETAAIASLRPRPVAAAAIESIANEFIRVSFDNATNLLTKIENLESGVSIDLTQQIYKYTSVTSGQPSGAYIFAPTGPAQPYVDTDGPTLTVIDGPLVKELRQVFRAGIVSQVVRLYVGLPSLEGSFVEVVDMVGPLPTDTEIVTRFSTNLDTDMRFYTDNNGLELQERISNPSGRPGDENAGVALAGNFYPAVARAMIRDVANSVHFSVLSQSTHAASSLAEGELELLLHRRCSRDDARGMQEPLDDTDSISAPLRLIVNTAAEDARRSHRHVLELQFPPNVYYGLPAMVVPAARSSYSGLKATLPENVHLVSLNPRKVTTDEVVVRFLHLFEVDEHPTLSQPASVDLDIFSNFVLAGAEERTLTLLHQLDANPPLTNLTLTPLQIRSFVLTLNGAVHAEH